MLRFLLFFQLLYVVNQVHFPWETGIPGLAPANIVFLLLLYLLKGKTEVMEFQHKSVLREPMLRFFAVLPFAFLIAQVRQFNDVIADATYLKNAAFFPLYYFMYLHCKQDLKTTRYLIIFIMVIAAVAGLEAVREGLDYGIGNYNPSRRASGPFGVDWRHANRAGVFYGMFTPMFVAIALFMRGQKLWRLSALGGIVLLSFGALFTYSRQSYFLIVFGSAVLLLRRSIAAALAVGILLVPLVGYLPDSVTQRVAETKQEGDSGAEEVDMSTASRWEIWGGAMSMLRDNPLGVGLNRFKANIGNYTKFKGFDAHNFYVLTLAETGFQGLIPLILLWVALLRLAANLRQNAPPDDPEFQALAQGFSVTTLVMFMGGIYGSPHFEGSVMGCYWALCGLLERYSVLKQTRTVAPAQGAEPSPIGARFPLSSHILPGRKN